MEKGLRAYGEILRLVRRLPKDTRPYYSKYTRENFVNYRDADPNDANALDEIFNRTYVHATWVLSKYSVNVAAADKLKEICCNH
ncbi:LYR motif-containing protein At3g19508 [Macadamia integrifolia]|uniref:LYR motif-containing protein At3g19508 n=1 Tax=Macadamia integrifolia TaxID=60698 RepID=UPI001C4F21F8|nr:LYR motif-containing protein At3g19508 [Macadamia integrifolia]